MLLIIHSHFYRLNDEIYNLNHYIGGLRIPLPELKEKVSSFHEDQSIVFYCKSGIRSRQAAQIVREAVPKIKLYCLKQ